MACTAIVGHAQSENANVSVSRLTEMQKVGINGYAFTEIADERKDRTIGRIATSNGHVMPFKTINDLAASFKKHISQNYSFYDVTKQIRIDIKSVSLDETPALRGGIDGVLNMKLVFDIIKGDDLYAPLAEYSGTIRYRRLISQNNTPEFYVYESLKSGLKYFDGWYAKNKNDNALLAQHISLTFKNYTEDAEGDTIYYSANRHLTWADFKDKPRYGKYAAEVIPGLGFTESTKVQDGVIVVDISLKVYLPKSAAWVKPGEENEINLNHEQRHFDIVKIVGERFKTRMLQEKLPVYNYDGYINVAYFDALREITTLQRQYDQETVHGSNLAEQQRWNKKIDAELTVGSSGGS